MADIRALASDDHDLLDLEKFPVNMADLDLYFYPATAEKVAPPPPPTSKKEVLPAPANNTEKISPNVLLGLIF